MEESRVGGHRRVGGCEHRPGIQLQQEVDHGRISGDDHHRALRRVDPGALGKGGQQLRKGFHRGSVQLVRMGGIFQGIGDPGQNIGPVFRLAVDAFFLAHHGA